MLIDGSPGLWEGFCKTVARVFQQHVWVAGGLGGVKSELWGEVSPSNPHWMVQDYQNNQACRDFDMWNPSGFC